VFRLAWEHGVNGQAQVIKGMQQIIHSYTLLQDKEAMSEAVANVRWVIAVHLRDEPRGLFHVATMTWSAGRSVLAPVGRCDGGGSRRPPDCRRRR
jgi:hypothetical protein